MGECVDCQIVHVSAYRGDSVELAVTLMTSSGALVDAYGWVWRSYIRDASGTQVGTWTENVEQSDKGLLTLALTQAETEALGTGDFSFDLEANDSEGSTRTLVEGKLRIREDVSHG